GLVTAWRLAGCPISRSPSLVNATIEGVVRVPSEFSMTFGLPPSITATQLLVVPRSMPMTLPIVFPFLTSIGDAAPVARWKDLPVSARSPRRLVDGGRYRCGFSWHKGAVALVPRHKSTCPERLRDDPPLPPCFRWCDRCR